MSEAGAASAPQEAGHALEAQEQQALDKAESLRPGRTSERLCPEDVTRVLQHVLELTESSSVQAHAALSAAAARAQRRAEG